MLLLRVGSILTSCTAAPVSPPPLGEAIPPPVPACVPPAPACSRPPISPGGPSCSPLTHLSTGGIPIQPIKELRKGQQHVMPCNNGLALGVIIPCHHPLDTHKAPQPPPHHRVVQVGAKELLEHEHEPPYDVQVHERPAVPVAVGCNGLKERLVEHNELDVYVRGVRLVEHIHVCWVAKGLLSVCNLLGANQKPLVAAWDADVVGPLVIFVAGGEASQLNYYVPTAVVGAALGQDPLYKRQIVDVGGLGTR